jgi:hypothetical protein
MALIKNQSLKLFYRLLAGLFGCFALALQLYLIIKNAPDSGKSYFSETIRFFSYMTVMTNILVTLTFLVPLFAKNSRLGRFLSGSFMETGTMLYITVVGVSYHFLLSHIWAPTGWQKVADVSLHYVVPIAYIIYWFLFVSKGAQHYSNAYKWLVFPLTYLIYALLYGAIVKAYAYPFIDVIKYGYGTVLKNGLLLGVGYYLMGLLLIFIDKQIGRSTSN